MAKFFLTGARAGASVTLGGYVFLSGICEVPDREAPAAANILMRFYEATTEEPLAQPEPVVQAFTGPPLAITAELIKPEPIKPEQAEPDAPRQVVNIEFNGERDADTAPEWEPQVIPAPLSEPEPDPASAPEPESTPEPKPETAPAFTSEQTPPSEPPASAKPQRQSKPTKRR